MKKIIVSALLLLGVAPAWAQFSPGQILSAAALNSQFAIYAPLGGATFTGPVTIPTLTLGNPLSIASGGTNSASASGTTLDNITGFSGTGFMSRTGSGAYSFTASTGSGSVVLSNGASMGAPSAITLTNGTGLPLSTGITGLGSGVAAGLANAATGSGAPVLATSPTIGTPTITGVIPSYNGISTAGGGVPIIVADTGTTYLNKTANFGPVTLYTVPSGQDGWYTVIMRGVVTTSASTSSTLPNTTIAYTDFDSSGTPNANIGATNGGNTANTANFGIITVYGKALTGITAQTTGYASNPANAMAYSVRYVVEYLGP